MTKQILVLTKNPQKLKIFVRNFDDDEVSKLFKIRSHKDLVDTFLNAYILKGDIRSKEDQIKSVFENKHIRDVLKLSYSDVMILQNKNYLSIPDLVFQGGGINVFEYSEHSELKKDIKNFIIDFINKNKPKND